MSHILKESPQFTCVPRHTAIIVCGPQKWLNSCGMSCSCCYVAAPQLLSELHDISFSSWIISVASCAPLTNRISSSCMRNMKSPASHCLDYTLCIFYMYHPELQNELAKCITGNKLHKDRVFQGEKKDECLAGVIFEVRIVYYGDFQLQVIIYSLF